MMKNKLNNNLRSGVAALLTIFVLGFISLLIGVSLVQTGYASSIRGRNQTGSLNAFYAAQSGVEEAMLQVQTHSFGNTDKDHPDTLSINVGDGKADVNSWWEDNEDQRFIESVGTYKNYVRRIKIEVQNTTTMPGFVNAIHAGNGGVELEGHTKVTGKDGVPGNVYSKSFIKGKNKNNTATGCQNAASAIYGSAWAVGVIDTLSPGGGVCITDEVSATFLNSCYAHGLQFSPDTSKSCGGGSSQFIESIPIKDLPDLGEDRVKDYLSEPGSDKYTGNCKITGSGNPGDCLGGTDSLGSIKIIGDLEVDASPGVTIKFTGPIWVTGNLVIKSNTKIKPLSTSLSQITVVDGKIASSSNTTYYKNVDAFLLFVSTYISGDDSSSPGFCNNPAISLSSNNESVLFYAKFGCVQVDTGTAVGGFKGALLGEAIRIKNNTEIEYDPDLQTAILGLTNSGGWQTLSFKEY